jgi:hypothetical protein
MDHSLKPGAIVMLDGPPSATVIFRVPNYNIRVTGRDLDISLSIVSAEDIEIIEKLLAKIRASLSAGDQHE